MKRQLHVVLATGVYPPEEGGPATYSKLLNDELPKMGISVKVFPFREVRHLPKGIRHIVFLCKLIKQIFWADIYYAQDTVSVGFPTFLAAKLTGKKFLIRVPGDYSWEQSVQRFGVQETIDDFQNNKYGIRVEVLRFFQRLVVRGADIAITPSEYFRDLVRNWVKDKQRVITIYNGIDFSKIPERRSGDFVPRTLITAGRLVPWKGFRELIFLMEGLPDWKLYIAGDGPMRAELETLISNKNLSNRVVLLGSITQSELFKKIQDAEIFILNTSFESFSYQLVEVMRIGTPIITTNVGNLPEIITNGVEGILVEHNNIEQIKESILGLKDNSVRSLYTDNAYKKSENFDLKNTISKTAEVIQHIINNK